VDQAWWRARWSMASGCSRARKVASGVGKGRREHDEVIVSFTRTWAAVRWPGADGEEAMTLVLGGGGAQARRGGEVSGEGCCEVRRGSSPLYRG
jgi:hypothetical protein